MKTNFKTALLIAFLFLYVSSPFEVSAQNHEETEDVKKERMVSQRFDRINTLPDSLLAPQEVVEKYEIFIWNLENSYMDEKGILHTKITKEECLKKGYPEYYYHKLIEGVEELNKFRRAQLKTAQDIEREVKAWNDYKERFRKEDRQTYLQKMEDARKKIK